MIGSTPGMMIAIADGAGSARLSQIGARVAVDHLLKIIPSTVANILDLNSDVARQWLKETRGQLEATASEQGCDLRDLGCTVLVAILGEFASFFIQIGDGAWIVQRDDEYLAATWPSDGEYVNETTFLTSPNSLDSIKCRMIDGICAAAGFSDGLQRLALQLDTHTVHAPFFDPLFAVLRATDDETSLISPLVEFLSSERVAERTDDDKTLVLACQLQPLLLQC
jgi:Protein phosphatase 2C